MCTRSPSPTTSWNPHVSAAKVIGRRSRLEPSTLARPRLTARSIVGEMVAAVSWEMAKAGDLSLRQSCHQSTESDSQTHRQLNHPSAYVRDGASVLHLVRIVAGWRSELVLHDLAMDVGDTHG